MIERGLRKYREWEGRFPNLEESYPSLDCELRDFLPELYRYMRGISP